MLITTQEVLNEQTEENHSHCCYSNSDSSLGLVGFTFIHWISIGRMRMCFRCSQPINVCTVDNGVITIINAQNILDNPVGLIFYPGGKVEATAYLLLLDKLSEQGMAEGCGDKKVLCKETG